MEGNFQNISGQLRENFSLKHYVAPMVSELIEDVYDSNPNTARSGVMAMDR